MRNILVRGEAVHGTDEDLELALDGLRLLLVARNDAECAYALAFQEVNLI